MISKNSFLVSSRENNKRRVWVWILSLFIQLACYPGILTIYLSRINYWYRDGAFNDGFRVNTDAYKKALYNAAADGLGFQPHLMILILFLGALIGIQGFSYLYDRKKVDLYHSVPVSSKKRFFVVYINGILIYLIPNVAAVVLGIVMATFQGAVNGRVLAECGLAFVLNLLYFLVVYHTAILAVMLTGHFIITVCALGTFLFIGYLIVELEEVLRYEFFATADAYFDDTRHYFSICMDYLQEINNLKVTELFSDIVEKVLSLCGKWTLCAVLFFALAYLCYRKRPAEAAGKAVAFGQIKPFVKMVISVVFGIFIFYYVYDSTYYNMLISVLALVIGTICICFVMEILFEFDIRAMPRHPVSTGISAVLVLIICSIYYFDIFGYDQYVPEPDKVESVAVRLDDGQQRYWEWMEEMEGMNHINPDVYIRENMFLTDVDAVCKLAEKSRDAFVEYRNGSARWNMTEGRNAYVLYRLKSGKEVHRCFQIDFADASNEELLNRIIQTPEYREGTYQIVKGEDFLMSNIKSLKLSYENGTLYCMLPSSEAGDLREAWLNDMVQFDFSLARNNLPCGVLQWDLDGEYVSWTLPVYESFENTIAYLKEHNAYYPIKLRTENIASLEITNYHKEDQLLGADMPVDASGRERAQTVETSPVSCFFEDREEIARIAEGLYPSELRLYWNEAGVIDDNYEVEIVFKTGADYLYGGGYFHYYFLDGQVPDFVVERTALPVE